MADGDARPGVVAAWRRHWPLLVVLAGVAAAAVGTHRQGIGWGDDHALYLRQARALFDGNIGQVIADNHDNVRLAARPGFSPDVYPWGWPLIAAPFVRLWGVDVDRLKLVEVACWLTFLGAFHAIVGRRVRPAGHPSQVGARRHALLLTAVVGLSLAYLRHTGQLLSELPYLAVAAACLVWLDRCRRSGPLDLAPHRDLAVLGLLAMAVFNVRREGAAMALAVVATQITDGRGRWQQVDRRAAIRPALWCAGGAVAAQLVLPSALAPHYDGAGLANAWKVLRGRYPAALREQLGVPAALGGLTWVVLALVVVGIVVRCWRAAGDDIALVVFPAVAMVVAAMHPAAGFRYLLPITPFAVYFAYQGIAAVAAVAGRARPVVASSALTLVLAAVVVGHVSRLPGEWRAASRDEAAALPDGPLHPSAQAAFDAVVRHTRRDDIVGFFKARTMTLFTDRRSVQSSNRDVMLERADYFLMRRGSDFSQPLISDADAESLGLTEMWADDVWVLWQIPHP